MSKKNLWIEIFMASAALAVLAAFIFYFYEVLNVAAAILYILFWFVLV